MVLKRSTRKLKRENRPKDQVLWWEQLTLVRFLKNHTLPGFQEHSIFEVGRYFIKSLFREDFTLRASSLAFNFFLALFPALLFLFTLIAYIPIRGLRFRLINELNFFLPDAAFETISDTITDIMANQNGSLLSFGFMLAIWFTSNGFHTMISTFNRILPRKKKRNWFHNRGLAIQLTFVISMMLIAAVIIIVYAGYLQSWIYKHKIVNRQTLKFLLSATEFVVLTGLVFLVISTIYRVAPANVSKWKFLTPGSILASVLCIGSTYLFTLYVNNFNSYNKIYGSIGAIIALMILIYINTLSVIAGFELNSSVDRAGIALNDKNSD
jgi:membrane protein